MEDIKNGRNVRVVRSDRRTVSIIIERDLSVTVRAPRRIKEEEIERILREKAAWIERHRAIMRQRVAEEAAVAPMTEQEKRACRAATAKALETLVPMYAERIGVTYSRVCVRFQKTRYGSCSSRGTLSFHAALSRMPREVMEYVVVHELCHRKHMDHSAAFWTEVERYCPTYREARRWLKEKGSAWLR